MTPPLHPCPSCDRHVRVTESACPFCDAPLPRRPRAQSIVPAGRLGSLAVLTFRAAAIGAALNACGGEASDDDGAAGAAGKQHAGMGGSAGTPGDDLGGANNGARAGANHGGAPSFAGAPTDGGITSVYRATPKG